MEEANFLTKFCKKVYLVHRRGEYRASKIMLDRALKNSKIEFVTPYEVKEIRGASTVESVVLSHVENKDEKALEVQGVFVAIGHIPNTSIFKGQLEMNEQGYLNTNGENTATTIPGVFSAGDVHDFRYRQAITAAGSGCKAALDAEKYLESLHD